MATRVKIVHEGNLKTLLGAATTEADGYATSTQIAKLGGIDEGAEVNNISDVNATDLTDGGATTLHKHSYTNLDDKPTIPTLPVKASGAEVDTGEDDAKFVTPKAMEDSSYIKSLSGLNQTKAWTLIDPKGAYGKDHEIFVWKTDAAITITKIEVSCDADPATEITGDLKWADAFIGLANATVINDFDTTAGVRSDTSITAGAVGAGKCIYISFDAEPLEAITQINFSITYDND